jgi:hypothetical protein
MSSLMFDIYLRATPQQVRSVLAEPAMVPSWLDGLRFSPAGEVTCEWLQTERLEINGGASSVVRFDLIATGEPLTFQADGGLRKHCWGRS